MDTDFGEAAGREGAAGADWKIAPEDVAEVGGTALRMPARTEAGRVDMRPCQPQK